MPTVMRVGLWLWAQLSFSRHHMHYTVCIGGFRLRFDEFAILHVVV